VYGELPLGLPEDPTTLIVKEREERHGLFLLKDSTMAENAQDEIKVDVIAIHGLNGDAFSTWEHEKGTLWLRDLLPEELPGSRIYTYGYPSDLFFSKTMATPKDYARDLLDDLANIVVEGVI
jgi:hypothetical protein